MKKILVTFFFLLITGYSLLVTSTAFAINLQVPLPNLSNPSKPVESFDVCQDTGTRLECNGITRYIVAGYEWLMGAVGILVLIVFSYAGLLWLSARGDNKQVEHAKKLLKDALAGLVLMLGSYVILWTINPNLVNLNPLLIPKITPIDFSLDPEDLETDDGPYDPSHIALMPGGFKHLQGKSGPIEDDKSGEMKSNLTDVLKLLDDPSLDIYVSTVKGGHKPGTLHGDGRGADIHGTEASLKKAMEKVWDSPYISELFLGLDDAKGAIINNRDGGDTPGKKITIAELKEHVYKGVKGKLFDDHAGSHLHLHIGVIPDG